MNGRGILGRLPLQTRFALASVLVIAIITAVLCLVVLDRVRASLADQLEKRGEALSGQLASLGRFPLRTGGGDTLEELARGALLAEDVVSVTFIDDLGREAARAGRESPDLDRLVVAREEIPLERPFEDDIDFYTGAAGSSVSAGSGEVVVELSLAGVDRFIAELRLTILLLGLGLVLVSALFSHLLSRRITDPIDKLMEGVEAIGEGRLDTRIDVDDGAEIGRLAERVNMMAKDLRTSMENMVQQEKMATLGRMSSCISHEIGSPLNSILIDAHAAMAASGDNEAREALESIIKQTKRMRDIVRNLLDYARSPSREMEEVDIAETLGQALMIMAHGIRKSNIKIERDIPSDLPRVMGVSNMLEQVFVNIVDNAIDATEDNEGERRLWISAALDGEAGAIEMRFADNGRGLAKDVAGSIFEPFQTDKPEGQGTGLGLAICRQIMLSMDGDIRAGNLDDKGAEILLIFRNA